MFWTWSIDFEFVTGTLFLWKCCLLSWRRGVFHKFTSENWDTQSSTHLNWDFCSPFTDHSDKLVKLVDLAGLTADCVLGRFKKKKKKSVEWKSGASNTFIAANLKRTVCYRNDQLSWSAEQCCSVKQTRKAQTIVNFSNLVAVPVTTLNTKGALVLNSWLLFIKDSWILSLRRNNKSWHVFLHPVSIKQKCCKNTIHISLCTPTGKRLNS